MSESIAAIERLYRRVMLVVGRGRIKTGSDTGAAQQQQVTLGPFETFDNVPRLSEYGFNSMPPPESDAVLIFVGGNRVDGVIIATGNQTYRMRSLKPGEVSISDNLGQSVYLTQNGIVVSGAGLPVLVTNTPEITLDTPLTRITGDAEIDGNLTVGKNATVQQNLAVEQSVAVELSLVAQGDISDQGGKSMAGMRQVFNGHGHQVSNVQTGSASILSATPNHTE